MTVVHRIVSFGYNLLQRHFNVGHPTEQFFLLRCLDVVSRQFPVIELEFFHT